MNTEELAPIVTAHQVAISRHDQQMAEINATLDRIAKLQAFNQVQLNQFTAGMIDLRSQVADFVKSREQSK